MDEIHKMILSDAIEHSINLEKENKKLRINSVVLVISSAVLIINEILLLIGG